MVSDYNFLDGFELYGEIVRSKSASRGAGAKGWHCNATGCGFNSHSRKLKYLKLYFFL